MHKVSVCFIFRVFEKFDLGEWQSPRCLGRSEDVEGVRRKEPFPPGHVRNHRKLLTNETRFSLKIHGSLLFKQNRVRLNQFDGYFLGLYMPLTIDELRLGVRFTTTASVVDHPRGPCLIPNLQ